jgi:hypothetical protein
MLPSSLLSMRRKPNLFQDQTYPCQIQTPALGRDSRNVCIHISSLHSVPCTRLPTDIFSDRGLLRSLPLVLDLIIYIIASVPSPTPRVTFTHSVCIIAIQSCLNVVNLLYRILMLCFIVHIHVSSYSLESQHPHSGTRSIPAACRAQVCSAYPTD